jgi:hypothetical protein
LEPVIDQGRFAIKKVIQCVERGFFWDPFNMKDHFGGCYFDFDVSASMGFGMEWVEEGNLGFSSSEYFDQIF